MFHIAEAFLSSNSLLYFIYRCFKDVEEAVAFLHSMPDDDDTVGYDFALEPPDEGNESDVDDLNNDTVIVDENLNLLGSRLLAMPAAVTVTRSNGHTDELLSTLQEVPISSEPPRKKGKITKSSRPRKIPVHKPTYSWKKGNFASATESEPEVQHMPHILKLWDKENSAPIDVFNYFWNEEIIDLIVKQTNAYHQLKFGRVLNVTSTEIRQLFGILILSGYTTVPNRRLYWSTSCDTRNLSVTNCGMTSKRFELIISSLHFADNSNIDANDKIFKVRSLFDHFNKLFIEMAEPLPQIWAIDEAMEPYFGRHHMKQFIRGKPVRFGFKFWCLCSREGILLKFKLYEGRDGNRDNNMGVGESVVTNLALNLVPKGSSGFIDNFFTSLPLLEKFKNENINLTGTLRKDRIRSVPLADFKKTERGGAEVFIEEKKGIAIFHWQDNSDVIIGSNEANKQLLTMSKCNRWSTQHKKVVSLPQPRVIQMYNHGMGGVDLFDQFRAKYRISFRKRTWYYPLFRFILNATVVNGWLYFRKIRPQTQLDFTRDIVNNLLKPAPTPKKHIPRSICERGRFDGLNHNVVMGPTQRRCGVCKKNVRPMCTKCDIALHIECWLAYHTPPK